MGLDACWVTERVEPGDVRIGFKWFSALPLVGGGLWQYKYSTYYVQLVRDTKKQGRQYFSAGVERGLDCGYFLTLGMGRLEAIYLLGWVPGLMG